MKSYKAIVKELHKTIELMGATKSASEKLEYSKIIVNLAEAIKHIKPVFNEPFIYGMP